MEDAVELTTFTATGDVYIYAPLPPATSYGHRAELWNPDKWMQEVKLKVVTAGDHCFVRMLSKENGELFAECPLPVDGTPLTTVVEAVVDSSRYFVVKVVDRESRKHAFIGIGFRDRMDASDFAAALDDYRQYLRRKQEAAQLRQEFETLRVPSGNGSEAANAEGSAQDAAGQSAAQKDFSLKPGETLHIKLSPSLKRGDISKGSAGSIVRSGSAGSSGSSSPGSAAVPRLAPPGTAGSSGSSSSGFFRLQPPPAASASATAAAAAAQATSATAGAGASTAQPQQQCGTPAAAGQQSAGPGRASLDGGGAGAGASVTAAASAEAADDEWGDFVG